MSSALIALPGHQHALAPVARRPAIVIRRRRTELAGKLFQPWDVRDSGAMKPARGHNHAIELFAGAGVAEQPCVAGAPQQIHAGAQSHSRGDAEHVGVAVQVGQDVAVRRIGGAFAGREVAESGQDPAAVGAHVRPHAAAAVQACPLPTECRPLFEERDFKALRQQPARRDQSAGTGPDHRHAVRHLATFARTHWLRQRPPVLPRDCRCGCDRR